LLPFTAPQKLVDARKQQYTTLEHLLLALTNDANASKVMLVCWKVSLVETLSQGRHDSTTERADRTWLH